MARSHEDCLKYLEKIRWQGKPKCPYCKSFRTTKLKKENRYHCNHCFTSYSVTVDTLFHNSRVKLNKWFTAIFFVTDQKNRATVRGLAKLIEVNKNTAATMISRIRDAQNDTSELLTQIIRDKNTFWVESPEESLTPEDDENNQPEE
ncbi:putative transposase [Leptolyngbya sp. Heron Island J]|uniref:transposase n=1 Tax=Leptolyngbya sp. Heron Island J TaxID=1385935 RepID=UPI0003B9A80F|nr:transposase [Leptolyngbya sp. Heron Island J]ESA32962.1 putative transposase [Leptolyngbya sp. Heron Island J]